jgi:hypothetical protein
MFAFICLGPTYLVSTRCCLRQELPRHDPKRLHDHRRLLHWNADQLHILESCVGQHLRLGGARDQRQELVQRECEFGQQPHDSSKLVIREAESELHGVRVAGDAAVTINATGSSYGYGPIPMMSVETVETKLPVMPWNTSSEIELMEIDRSSQLPRLA